MRVLRKGFSIIEVAVMTFVIAYGLTAVYLVLGRGWKLAETTSNRIAAINLAREGIEAVTNARDTNWIKFAADYPGCWKTQNYNRACVGSNTPANTWFGSGATGSTATFVPFLSGSLWFFTGATNSGVYMDAVGLPFQTGASLTTGFEKTCQFVDPNATSCRTNMRRRVTVGHPVTALCGGDAGTGCLSVSSQVDWFDGASQREHSVKLDTTLTNWRNNF